MGLPCRGSAGIGSPGGSGVALLERQPGGCGGVRAMVMMGMASAMILERNRPIGISGKH
jgi:hypothetical protein